MPVYDVAAYLDTCLESLAAQTMGDFEAILVDDGSTDASPEIAGRFAARDPRFRLVRQPNAGLGAARNTGIRHATGEFIAFLDSDDVLPRHAYELLLAALGETRSDFAAGNVRRLTPWGTTPVGFLSRAFERTRLETHVTRFPVLLSDRMAWNKLFRKSFWDEHGFRFPQGVYYEDTPVTLPAHYLARSVDLIEQPVYLWRVREGGDLSITQRRTETKTLRDRVAAVDHVSRFLADQRLGISKAVYDRTVVGQDLRYFLDVLPSASEEFRRLFLDLANEFIDRADPWVLEQRLAIDRLKWQLVRRRALPELLEVLRFEDEELADVPPVRLGRRWYGDYPYRGDRRLAIPLGVYRLADELAPVFRVNDVRWEGDRLRIEGYAYIDMIGAAEPGPESVELVARSTDRRARRAKLATRRVHRPDVTANAAQGLVGLDWSGFVATLDGSCLRRAGRWLEGSWEIGVVVRAHGVSRKSWRPEPAPLHALASAEFRSDDGTHVSAGVAPNGRLTVRVERARPVVRHCFSDDDVLQLEGDAHSSAGRRATLRVRRPGGSATYDYPVHIDRSPDRPTFLGRIPVAELVANDSSRARVYEDEVHAGSWEVDLADRGLVRPLALDEAAPQFTLTVNGREIGVERGPAGGFTIVDRSVRPLIQAAEWSPDGALLVRGSLAAPAGDYELVLGPRSRARNVSAPLRYDTDTGAFTAEITLGAVESLAGPRPLAEGLWDLRLRRRDAAGEADLTAVVDCDLLGRLPLSVRIGHKRFHLGVADGDRPVLAVERDLDDDERGGFTQRRLRTSFYRSRRDARLRDVVLYDCFGGREYSDSPRAIHEELVRRGAPFEHLWVVRDRAFRVPETAVGLRELSREYYEAYARARYVVANDYWPRWFVRRPDQTCVQTWHGGPLKRHGYDLADRPTAFRDFRRALHERPENWQYVVSPGAWATPILARVFPTSGEIIETGLPRTDVVVRPDRDRADEVGRRLRLPGKRVVLYAPTYRDHREYRAGPRLSRLRDEPTWAHVARDGYRLGPMLDLSALHSAIGDDHVILFRKPPRVADGLREDAQRFVRDVSEYPDLTELLLVADALVTDYSSSIFDFASTRRPIVFFTPDLDAYRDSIRGFSIDFERVAPGPLLTTTSDVIDALRQPDAVREESGTRYDAFVGSYCALNDGGAASRVVERVFRW